AFTFTTVTANHTIAASFASYPFTITATARANDSIPPPRSSDLNSGSNQSFTITPNTGYHVADVLVDGSSVGAVTSFTFTNVTAKIGRASCIESDHVPITASAGGKDSMTPSVPVSVEPGRTQSFTVTDVTAHHTIAASFEIYPNTITDAAAEHGCITHFGALDVNSGSNQSFTITPNTGYHVADVLVDGSSVGAVTSFTFTNVTA